MTKIPPRKTGNTEWLEPPQWWKKVRPLRWLGGLALILLLYSWLGPDSEKDSKQAEVVAVATTQAAAFDNSDLVSTPAPTEVPAPVATAEAARPTPPPATPTAIPTAMPTASATPVAASSTPAATAAAAVTEASTDKATDQVESDESFVFEEEEVDPNSPEESELAEFTGIADDPVRLVGTFRSYASVDAVVFELERAGFKPIMESSNARPREGVPPRDLTTVTVSQFRHWSVVGKLTLQFFNDRLYQSEFEPDDPATYAKAQRRELPQVKSERSGRAVWVGGNLRIASSLDLAVSEVGKKLQSRPFLLWQDRRIVRQRDEWDRRFALASAKKKN
ncbi:MAG: hypothetical protein M3O62_00970 [Pseudomonadota bacterium]|nr:hypothetical protein [Pseudomonadota bacterium]